MWNEEIYDRYKEHFNGFFKPVINIIEIQWIAKIIIYEKLQVSNWVPCFKWWSWSNLFFTGVIDKIINGTLINDVTENYLDVSRNSYIFFVLPVP